MDRRILSSKGTLAVFESNERGGNALLLIHGFGESAEVWVPMMERFAAKSRAIRVDLLGHGASDKPDIAYDVPGQAQSVIEVLKVLSVRQVHIVAHSAGGDIAVSMIEQSRELVRSVTFLGTAPNLKFVHKSSAAKLMLVPVVGRLLWGLATEDMIRDGLKKAFAPNALVPPDVYVRSLRRMPYMAYSRCLTQIEAFKEQKNLCARIAGKNVPTLVVFGKQDQWVDPAAAEMWAREVGAKIELIDGVGHTHMAEAPDAIAQRIVEFVDGIGTS